VPTLEDVAKRAGVSTATVSKVLSNTPYFTEETRSKVMRAVAELGYIPNLAARALSSGKTGIIAVVFPYVYEAIFTDPNIMNTLEGIEAECTPRGYNLLLSTPKLSADGPDAHYQQLILSGYLDGVIAIDSYPLASSIKVAQEKGVPVVVVGYQECDAFVQHDDQAGGQMMMQHLIELGHSRIGIIGAPFDVNFGTQYRSRGARIVAEAAGLDYDAFPTVYGDWSTRSGADCAATLLEQYPDLTALFCHNDRMAMGAIQQARAMGRNVPDNLTVTGYDDIPTASVFSPPLTTIDQRSPEQGRLAARMLFEVLAGKSPDPIVLPPWLVTRQSSSAASG
jgi:DNA-binding LacI/PurR family transcriptional regulator